MAVQRVLELKKNAVEQEENGTVIVGRSRAQKRGGASYKKWRRWYIAKLRKEITPILEKEGLTWSQLPKCFQDHTASATKVKLFIRWIREADERRENILPINTAQVGRETGLSRKTVWKALEWLVKHHLMDKVETSGGCMPSRYFVRWSFGKRTISKKSEKQNFSPNSATPPYRIPLEYEKQERSSTRNVKFGDEKKFLKKAFSKLKENDGFPFDLIFQEKAKRREKNREESINATVRLAAARLRRQAREKVPNRVMIPYLTIVKRLLRSGKLQFSDALPAFLDRLAHEALLLKNKDQRDIFRFLMQVGKTRWWTKNSIKKKTEKPISSQDAAPQRYISEQQAKNIEPDKTKHESKDDTFHRVLASYLQDPNGKWKSASIYNV